MEIGSLDFVVTWRLDIYSFYSVLFIVVCYVAKIISIYSVAGIIHLGRDDAVCLSKVKFHCVIVIFHDPIEFNWSPELVEGTLFGVKKLSLLNGNGILLLSSGGRC